MPKLLRVAALVATSLLLLPGQPTAVSAHALYDHSDPAADATVTTAPSTVKVWFTEGVRPRGSSLKVTNAAGQQVDSNDSKVDTSDPDRKLMTVSLQSNLPAGTFTVNWVTISADDGDKADGTFNFTVRPATPTAAPAAVPAPAAVAPPAPPAPAIAAPAPAVAASQPAPAQAPRGLPRTGEGRPELASGGLLGIAVFLVAVGLLARRLMRAS